ncbi:MAG: hypothetical protein ACRDPC_07985 [Solirubrobacteraceae bacterium]
MELEERTLDDNLERTCEVCGAPLTEAEIHTAREAGPPFLCSLHMTEELPAQPTEGPEEQREGGQGGPPTAA